jgi:hypothetical protein
MLIDYFGNTATSVWFSWTMVASLAAAIAAAAAWFQFRAMSLQMRASLLLSMDQRWEDPSFKTNRSEYSKFKLLVMQEARLYRIGAEPDHDGQVLMQRYQSRLGIMLNDEPERYQTIMGICSFLETVGYAARARYLDIRDITNLLGGTIREASQVFQYHIRELQDAPGRDGLFRNCVWLFDQAWDDYENRHRKL